MAKQSDDKSVIVTEVGEQLKHPEGVPTDNIGLPVHDWRSKAFELVSVSERRRKIIRRLVRANSKLHRK